MTWIATAIAVIGAGVSYHNTEQTQKRQDNEIGLQIQQQSKRQEQADREVQDLIAERAASDGGNARRSTLDAYLSRVRAAQGAATGGLQQVGGVSSAYQAAANDAALGISDYANNAASLMSRIDAPTRLRQQEALQSADLSSRLGLIANQASGDDFLSRLRLQGIRRNPGLDAFSQVASAYAGAMGGGGGGARTSDLSGQANAITGANNAQIFNNSQRRWGY